MYVLGQVINYNFTSCMLVCTFQPARPTMTPRAVLVEKGKRKLQHRSMLHYSQFLHQKLGCIAKEFLCFMENLHVV
jgi:hypothetical protein